MTDTTNLIVEKIAEAIYKHYPVKKAAFGDKNDAGMSERAREAAKSVLAILENKYV